ncbi:MAG: Holliday junction branch migration protein RuvA [Candidatus Gracilibacteria bacterium]|nr:Holliday junction branch migration protein RuvA [Candidatus Gracilibacteria bacterium]
MISYITGKIIDLDFTNMTILTNSGVGYEVLINELTYSKLATLEEVELFIYHYKTENSESLFGFIEKEEKKVFGELIKISGIGGKVAMQILSLGVERLVMAIKGEDNKTIESIKGVGKKMAEKIILELKDKEFAIDFRKTENVLKANNIDASLYSSIKSTLTAMGYNPKDIDSVLAQLPEELKGAQEIIPYVIKSLS